MSEKLPEVRPVLALIKPEEKGGTFRAEVWNTTGEINPKGLHRIVSQDFTTTEDGEKIGREKYVYPEALSDKNQADLAEYLAADRNPTAEELDRHIQPVLSRRKDGRIEVWNKTGKVNENGSFQIMSQVPEEIDGKTDLVTRYVKKELFDPRVQDTYAHELGMDRNPTTAELDRHPEAVGNLGAHALGVVGVESPSAASKPTYVEHLNHLQDTREVDAPKDTVEVKKTEALSALGDCIRDFIARAKNGDATYSLENLGGRLDYVDAKLGNPKIDITKLLEFIPRFSGLRDAFEAALKVSSAEDVRNVIAANRVELSSQSEVIAEAPSVEVQAEAKDPLAEITKGLSEKDIKHLQSYASAIEQKKRAQQSDNGDGSTTWGRIAGEHMNDLTPKAREIVYRYADIYSRI